MFIKVADLPRPLRDALARVSYGRGDIRIEATEAAHVSPPSGDGKRGFAIAVALDDSGAIVERWGSWGGANAFSQTIDGAIDPVDLRPGVAVIVGCIGGGRPTYATIQAHPASLAPLLPAPTDASLGARALRILYAHKALKSGPYRQEELRAARATQGEIRALADRGLLKIDKRGAVQITTEGRNALESAGIRFSMYDAAWEKLAAERGE